MTDLKTIQTALEFLKGNQGFKVGGLYIAPRENEIAVVGQTNYNDTDNLIKEYAYAEESGYTFISSDAAFDNAVEGLKTHVQSRNDAVIDYLN